MPTTQEEVEATEDILLATRTIALLGRHAEAVDAATSRSLGAALVRYQQRFAQPLVLPFGLGLSFPAPLPTPRDTAALVKSHALYPCEPTSAAAAAAGQAEEDIVSDRDGNRWFIAGGATWQKRVAEGKLSGPDAVAPDLSEFRWVRELFGVFEKLADDPEARRLAAAWLYVASEADLSPDLPEDAEAERETTTAVEKQLLGFVGFAAARAKAAALEGLKSRLGALVGAAGELPDEDEDEDDDFEPEDEDDEDEDEEMDEDTAKAIALSMETSVAQPEAAQQPAEVPAVQQQPEVAQEPDDVKEIRAEVLRVVEKLGAFMPSPRSDAPFFKRMLKKMRLASCGEDWFPFGKPPVAKVVEVAETLHARGQGDSEMAQFLGEILEPFYHLQQEQLQEAAAAAHA